MFEDMTYENILNQALLRVSDKVDKRQGAIVYDAIAPACAVIAQLYIWLDEVLNETFADTASREYLIRRAMERGIAPYAATKAVLKGVFNIDVPIGSRFNLEKLNYTVTEKLEDEAHTYLLECETAGSEGNRYLGKMTPIEYIEGLTSAELTEVIIYGEDEEDTEDFRQRYLSSLNTQAFGGNVADYKQKVKPLEGVGQVRVYRADEWNGGGTVKIVITDTQNGMPAPELISKVQEEIDPVENKGRGSGIAPIGHIVTVAGVNEQDINVSLTVSLKSGYELETLKPYMEQAIKDYFDRLNASWEELYDEGEMCISVITSRIAGDIQSITGVANINGINVGGAGFGSVYTLSQDCIAVLGSLIVEVSE